MYVYIYIYTHILSRLAGAEEERRGPAKPHDSNNEKHDGNR